MSELRVLPDCLPMRYAPDLYVDDEDVFFDNGEVFFHGSVFGQRLEIHDLDASDKALRGGRTGIGRKAIESLREHFSEIVACQVGEDTAPIPEQPAFLFWRRMLVEGLIDAISVGYGDSVVTRDNLHDEIRTCYGTFIPSEGMEGLYAARV